MKPAWDQIWINLAKSIALRSNDPKIKVGAVIVTSNNESVLSIGYNGDEKGGSNERDSMETGGSGFIHAEVNAIAKMNYTDSRAKKIYLTHSPCLVCARLLINAGISEVIYDKEYCSDKRGLDKLREHGIVTRELPHWE